MDPPFSAAYTIIHINKTGQPDGIIPHDSDKGTYISACIHLTLACTKTEKGKKPFIDLAGRFLPRSIKKSWRKDMTDEQVVDLFFRKQYAEFSYVVDGEYLANEEFLAGHFRRPCARDGHNFDTCDQAILINGVVSRKQLDHENSVME